jgi:hypothetical protein
MNRQVDAAISLKLTCGEAEVSPVDQGLIGFWMIFKNIGIKSIQFR